MGRQVLEREFPQECFLLCFVRMAVKCRFRNVGGPHHKAAGRVFDRFYVNSYVKLLSFFNFPPVLQCYHRIHITLPADTTERLLRRETESRNVVKRYSQLISLYICGIR
jgi:hypothetical protein